MKKRDEPSSPLRICLISGAPAAGRCGIHDYVEQLVHALEKVEGVDATILPGQDWSPQGTIRLLKQVRALRPHVVHMQYPMIVGWWSLGPQFLGFPIAAPQVVTLHEFSSFTKLRRASMGAYALSAKQIIFTTQFEQQHFRKSFPRSMAKTSIIPIGSNIAFLPHQPDPEIVIAHFGQIKPGRGLEDFLQLALLAAQKGESWRFKVIGAPVTWAEGFVETMQQRTHEANVSWCLNVSDEEASQSLRGATAAYLPYPDGVSERRGSLIAALGNGVPVVTTRGPFQTPELDQVVRFAADPDEAYAEIAELVRHPAKTVAMRSAAASYVKRFDWDQIAEAHHAIYRKAVRP